MLLEGPPFSFFANVNLKLSHALFFKNLIFFWQFFFFPFLFTFCFYSQLRLFTWSFPGVHELKKCRIRERGTEFGIISAPGRVKNKRIRTPRKWSEKFAPLRGANCSRTTISHNWRPRGANCSTTSNCTTTANCSKLVFLCVYLCTIKVTRKSRVVYTPHIQIRSYGSAKECWELESAAISDKIRSFNRAKQGCTFWFPLEFLNCFLHSLF